MNLTKQVKNAALTLISANGSTTTLEVKEFLRFKYPTVLIVQNDVSVAMDNIFHKNKIKDLIFVDNGAYRIYGIGSIDSKEKIDKLTRTQLLQKIQDSQGKLIVVVFIKKDGTTRTILGSIDPADFTTPQGYIKFHEFGKQLKNVDTRTISYVGEVVNVSKLKE